MALRTNGGTEGRVDWPEIIEASDRTGGPKTAIAETTVNTSNLTPSPPPQKKGRHKAQGYYKYYCSWLKIEFSSNLNLTKNIDSYKKNMKILYYQKIYIKIYNKNYIKTELKYYWKILLW